MLSCPKLVLLWGSRIAHASNSEGAPAVCLALRFQRWKDAVAPGAGSQAARAAELLSAETGVLSSLGKYLVSSYSVSPNCAGTEDGAGLGSWGSEPRQGAQEQWGRPLRGTPVEGWRRTQDWAAR